MLKVGLAAQALPMRFSPMAVARSSYLRSVSTSVRMVLSADRRPTLAMLAASAPLLTTTIWTLSFNGSRSMEPPKSTWKYPDWRVTAPIRGQLMYRSSSWKNNATIDSTNADHAITSELSPRKR